MKDLIAERDKKEKMQHSVVKWWNVHYMTPEELGVEPRKKPKPEVEVVSMDQVNSGNVASVASSNTPPQSARTAEEEKIANLTSQMTDEQLQAAQDIIDRLNREAAPVRMQIIRVRSMRFWLRRMTLSRVCWMMRSKQI